MARPVRHAAHLVAALLLTVATVEADDLQDQTVLAAIEGELQAVLEHLGAEQRKPLVDQDAAKVAALARQVDGVRQRLAPLQPGSPVLQTRKIQVEAELDRVTYLANDMWRALQTPELVAARRAKEEQAQRKAEEARREVEGREEKARQDGARMAATQAKLLQFEKERAQEASRPLGQQRRAVYERLRADAAIVLAEADRQWTSGDTGAQDLRASLWELLERLHTDLTKLNVHEYTRDAKARDQARQQEAARREQARRVSIRAKGWSKAVEDAVVERTILLGMTPEQVREAWGAPQQINRTLTRYGEHEQWVYGLGQYLYFENGRLSSIQTSETPRR